tara:strand:+ start:1768 stop:2319 length:552 start_codon:yes stop_codon:yes gene_type:complete
MAFKLDGKPLAIDVAFKTSDGTQYPANWLRLASADDKAALKITQVADNPVYDSRFYWGDGTAKALDDVDAKDDKGNLLKNPDGSQMVILGVKSILKAQEKETAGSLLAKYDWYVVRKAEKSTAIPTAIQTFRDGVRTACDTREKEIDACSDTAALVTLYGATYDKDGKFEKYNMTQYPKDSSI